MVSKCIVVIVIHTIMKIHLNRIIFLIFFDTFLQLDDLDCHCFFSVLCLCLFSSFQMQVTRARSPACPQPANSWKFSLGC